MQPGTINLHSLPETILPYSSYLHDTRKSSPAVNDAPCAFASEVVNVTFTSKLRLCH